MQNPSKRLSRGLLAVTTAALVAVPVAQARVAVDARDAALLNEPRSAPVQTDAKIVQMHRHLAQLELPTVPKTTVESGGSFDWSDAGIGASAGLALVLLAGGGVLVLRRRPVTA
jgi:hypothetical protein